MSWLPISKSDFAFRKKKKKKKKKKNVGWFLFCVLGVLERYHHGFFFSKFSNFEKSLI
jgi:hypothetical protein